MAFPVQIYQGNTIRHRVLVLVEEHRTPAHEFKSHRGTVFLKIKRAKFECAECGGGCVVPKYGR